MNYYEEIKEYLIKTKKYNECNLRYMKEFYVSWKI